MKNRSLLAALLTVTTVATTVAVNVYPSYGQAQHLPRLGAKILPWIQGIGAAGTAVFSTHQAANAANARFNKCSNSGGKFNLPVDTWVGGTNGFLFAYSSHQFITIWSPYSQSYINTDNVFQFPKNTWLTVPNTPYAFCVNGKDGIVEARWEAGK
jgi:hypothetical protein